MRLVTYQAAGRPSAAGVLKDGKVVPVVGHADMLSVIAAGGTPTVDESKSLDLGAVKLRAPIARPNKLICVGLNYRDHAEESKMEIPKVPTIFNKFTTAIIGPGDAIVLPKNSSKPDYEAEFAVVIGKGGRHIPAESLARSRLRLYDPQRRQRARLPDGDHPVADGQDVRHLRARAALRSSPPTRLRTRTTSTSASSINGEVLQSSNTEHLIFDIPELIAYLSSVFTLEPGDIISTGTPAGVGFARKPPRFLKPGDDVVVKIAGIGELRNPVVAEA